MTQAADLVLQGCTTQSLDSSRWSLHMRHQGSI